MADKNNDLEGFDAEIEEAAASLDADSSLSLTNDTKLKPAPSSDLAKQMSKMIQLKTQNRQVPLLTY